MRAYADLHLCPPLDDLANARSMANLLTELETRTVGLVVPPERMQPCPAIVNLFKSSGIDVAARLDLKPRSREELLRGLRRFRNRYEVIAVECAVPIVSRVAVRDRRVDIVYFPKHQSRNIFWGNLAKSCRAALEFNMSEMILRPGLETTLHRVKGEIEAAAETSATVVGSTKASNPLELRSARDIAAVLHVFGLPFDAALRAVSNIPLAIVTKNRLRIGKPRPEEGVRILRRSQDGE